MWLRSLKGCVNVVRWPATTALPGVPGGGVPGHSPGPNLTTLLWMPFRMGASSPMAWIRSLPMGTLILLGRAQTRLALPRALARRTLGRTVAYDAELKSPVDELFDAGLGAAMLEGGARIRPSTAAPPTARTTADRRMRRLNSVRSPLSARRTTTKSRPRKVVGIPPSSCVNLPSGKCGEQRGLVSFPHPSCRDMGHSPE
jgi:hypothetical protein